MSSKEKRIRGIIAQICAMESVLTEEQLLALQLRLDLPCYEKDPLSTTELEIAELYEQAFIIGSIVECCGCARERFIARGHCGPRSWWEHFEMDVESYMCPKCAVVRGEDNLRSTDWSRCGDPDFYYYY